MRHLFLLSVIFFCFNNVKSQGLAVNNSGTAADGSAMLDVSSITRGALFPRMTLAQRTVIATPATGLLVYQTDGLNGFYYNAGTPAVPNWIRLIAENYWTLNGSNNIYNNNSGGFAGIGTSAPNAPLQFANDVRNRKLVLFEVANNDHQFYGFGVNSGVLRYQTGTTADDHVFYSGANAFASAELLRIRGNGNVGIATAAPVYRLDVNGRMRIRSIDATTNSAGIWLNESTNTERAFVGMENDNSVGLFGNNGAGWAFVMNTQTGKIRYQDGTQANGRVLTSDANGVASWVTDNTVQSVRTGSFGAGVNFDYNEMGFFPSGGTSKYTTVNITLPPGRWVVFANLLINGTALPAGGGIFVRTCLTESAVSSVCSPDVVAGTGGLISGNFSYSNTFSFVSGQVFINNSTGANKTYYLWANVGKNGSAPASGTGIGGLGSSFWSENQLFAIPMN